MSLLSDDQISQIREIALRRGLFRQRSVLLKPLDDRFQAMLEENPLPVAQLEIDLNALNDATRAIGNDIPMRRWLRTAASLISAYGDEASLLTEFASQISEHPEPSPSETARVANATIVTLQALSAQNVDVRLALAEARDTIGQVVVRLTRLVTRKRLHDVLHRLQIEGLPLIQASIVRERFEDPTQLAMIADHVGRIEIAYSEARSELDNLDPQWRDYSKEEKWIEQLMGISDTVRNAVENRNFDVAKSTVVDLRRLVRICMSRLNISITYSLDELDIGILSEHLRNFVALSLAPSDERAIQLRAAATRLLLLESDIEQLVGKHDQWQRVDDDLWSAEDDLIMREETANNLENFSRLWPSIAGGVQALAGEPVGAWYAKAEGWASAFQQKCPMPATPPLQTEARDDFRYFLQASRNQFRTVDLELKSRCNRLAALTRPLQDLGR